MGLYPPAIKKLIPPGNSDPRITPRVAILHVAVTNADSLHDYFDGPSGGIESHFYIRLDGTVEQYRDTTFEADANYRANPFAVSIETAGFGDGEWTKAQIESIKGLLAWLHDKHAIPLEVCKTPYGSGVGYHTMFGAPSDWTPVSKSCPGPKRIRQFHSIIAPWLKALSQPKPEYTRGESVDHALEDLKVSRGKGERGAAIKAAKRALRSIRKWVKK